MLNKKEIAATIEQMTSIKLLVETYEEIAAMDMRKIRSSVIANRSFIDELEDIYQKLEYSYQDQIAHLLAKKKNNKLTISKKNGKTVTIFFSANTKLYGDIVQRTFDYFKDFITTNKSDIIILGNLGQALMTENFPNRPFIYKDASDGAYNDPSSISDLLKVLLEYEKIYLFYGKYQTIATQKPYMLDVYGQQEIVQKEKEHTYYLFEPNLSTILQFFEQQIFGTIIAQSFSESALAKSSARMVSLDEATDNINNQMKKVYLQRRIIAHHLQNQKQQQSLASMHLWNGG